MREKEADGLAVVRTSASLGKCGADVDGLDLGASFLLLLVRNGVGDDDAAQAAVVDVGDGIAGKDTVHNDGVDLLGAVLHHSGSRLAEGTAGVGHVVDDDGDLVLHVTHKDHARDFVGALALLVDQSELEIETVGDTSGTLLRVSEDRKQNKTPADTYRLAPPASGLTMTQLFTSRFSRIHFSMLGSA